MRIGQKGVSPMHLVFTSKTLFGRESVSIGIDVSGYVPPRSRGVDAEFHELNDAIQATAENTEGYLGKRTWHDNKHPHCIGHRRNVHTNVFGITDMDSRWLHLGFGPPIRNPTHREYTAENAALAFVEVRFTVLISVDFGGSRQDDPIETWFSRLR